MLMDLGNLYSDRQAVTTTAASTNVIDHGATMHLGGGRPAIVRVQVTTASFTGGTSIACALQVDTAVGFGTAVTLQSVTLVLADLVLGAVFAIGILPFLAKRFRYSRLNYTVVGTMASGTLTAGLVDAEQFYQI